MIKFLSTTALLLLAPLVAFSATEEEERCKEQIYYSGFGDGGLGYNPAGHFTGKVDGKLESSKIYMTTLGSGRFSSAGLNIENEISVPSESGNEFYTQFIKVETHRSFDMDNAPRKHEVILHYDFVLERRYNKSCERVHFEHENQMTGGGIDIVLERETIQNHPNYVPRDCRLSLDATVRSENRLLWFQEKLADSGYLEMMDETNPAHILVMESKRAGLSCKITFDYTKRVDFVTNGINVKGEVRGLTCRIAMKKLIKEKLGKCP